MEKPLTYGSHHAKTCLRAYADNEGPDQTAHPQSDQGLHCPLTASSDTTKCMQSDTLRVRMRMRRMI